MRAKDITEALAKGLPNEKNVGKVLIIGAGVAGLATAQMLRKSGVEVQILEATSRYGGRVHTLTDYGKTPIEAGAEFVHGGKSAWAELADIHHKTMLNINNFEDVYYFEQRLWSEEEAYAHEDFAKVDAYNSLIEEADFSDTEGFISMAQFLHVIDCPPNVRHIADAWLSVDYGTSSYRIDARALQKARQQWSAGEQNFYFEKAGFAELVEQAFADALPCVLLEKPITQIHYSEQGVKVETPAGEAWEGQAVVLTVPLGVLKKYLITFSPALPAEKEKAIETIGIDAGMKILLTFSKAFWTPEVGAIFGKGYIPEFYPSAKDGEAILTALVMGENASHLSKLGEEEAIKMALRELDAMLGKPDASTYFVKGKMIDWGNTPFQWGAYSYPSYQSEEARTVLAKPIPPLYFAGEATHTEGHFATVHGALETAYRAVCEILGK
ncbi:MAG: FAD-dependent oxidoreductase [Bacteroidetes bacterium]|nr:MAG: FAD-dependent oxidoreductase [Bacteroidota bacterium]